jgi:energy-converting hydrogenase Eha subunit B
MVQFRDEYVRNLSDNSSFPPTNISTLKGSIYAYYRGVLLGPCVAAVKVEVLQTRYCSEPGVSHPFRASSGRTIGQF